jgi:predicted nuclease of predicted toxin-antitoxin system
VKLLFDENLSPKLVELLAEKYPGSVHLSEVGLRGASDDRIWEYARAGHYTIVSKDDDFRQRSFFEGAPPKVVWLQVGNARTDAIAELLSNERERILIFEAEDESSLLIVAMVLRAV